VTMGCRRPRHDEKIMKVAVQYPATGMIGRTNSVDDSFLGTKIVFICQNCRYGGAKCSSSQGVSGN